MKLMLFEEFLNEGSNKWKPAEKEKIMKWVDSVENFVNTVRDEHLNGNIEGFADKESTEPLCKLIYGEGYDLVSPPDLHAKYDRNNTGGGFSLRKEPGTECISKYLRVSKPDWDRYTDETKETMWGTGVSPESEMRMMKAYREMEKVREAMGSSLLRKLSVFIDNNDTEDVLHKVYDGQFMWDTKDPKLYYEEVCTPSKLRKFMEERIETSA